MAAESPFARLTSNQPAGSERHEAYRRPHAVISGIQQSLQRLLGDPDRELHSRAPHAQLVASTWAPRSRPADLLFSGADIVYTVR
ncbi:hypothetical protein AB0E01_07350 [Nocardia vinacea]|uniref:hypothetical protein n=1 Tax=Nocardia vinacea TaxID=96468 RepID=UPI0033CB02A6